MEGEPGLDIKEEELQRQVKWFQKPTYVEDIRPSGVPAEGRLWSESDMWELSLSLESPWVEDARGTFSVKELEGPLW